MQGFSIFVYLPVSDEIYACFRDKSKNVSELETDRRYSDGRPADAPFEVFLSLVVRQ